MIEALRELVAFREVLLVLVWRDLKARYRGSVLGFLWTFLNPLLLIVIYSLVFSVYMRVEIPAYPVFVFAGLLPWIWFSSAMLSGANSIIEGGGLIKRVAFPPQVLPVVSVTATLVNFLLGLPILLAFVVWSGPPVGWPLLALPLVIAAQYVFTVGLAVGLAMLTVRYRDLHQLLGNVLTLWFFLTPVLYPASMVPASFQPLLVLNPMAVLVTAFQSVLYHGQAPAAGHLAVVATDALLVFALGLALCQRLRWELVEDV